MATNADLSKYELARRAYDAQVRLYSAQVDAMNKNYEGKWEKRLCEAAVQRGQKPSVFTDAHVREYRAFHRLDTKPFDPNTFDFYSHAAMCRAEVRRILGLLHDNIPYSPQFRNDP